MLPNLYSLIINPAEYDKNLAVFFPKIFHLVKLKHLKIEYKIIFYQFPLYYYRDEHHYSTIERLVINAYIPYGSFYTLITNFPEPRSLSIDFLIDSKYQNIES